MVTPTDQTTAIANRIARQTLEKYLSVAPTNDYVKNHGFGLFNSPIVKGARLMLLGEQPGGPGLDFDPKEPELSCAIPDENLYWKNRRPRPDGQWKIARVLFEQFELMGELSTLQTSAVLNCNFFRARNRDEWFSNVPHDLRQDLESFSMERTQEIIAAVSPRLVLCLGLTVFDRIASYLGRAGSRTPGELYNKIRSTDYLLVGIRHPTGSRLSRHDWSIMRYHLARDFVQESSSAPLTTEHVGESSIPSYLKEAIEPIKRTLIVPAGHRLRGRRLRDGKTVYASIGRDGALADSNGYHYSLNETSAYVFQEPTERHVRNNGVIWEVL